MGQFMSHTSRWRPTRNPRASGPAAWLAVTRSHGCNGCSESRSLSTIPARHSESCGSVQFLLVPRGLPKARGKKYPASWRLVAQSRDLKSPARPLHSDSRQLCLMIACSASDQSFDVLLPGPAEVASCSASPQMWRTVSNTGVVGKRAVNEAWRLRPCVGASACRRALCHPRASECSPLARPRVGWRP